MRRKERSCAKESLHGLAVNPAVDEDASADLEAEGLIEGLNFKSVREAYETGGGGGGQGPSLQTIGVSGAGGMAGNFATPRICLSWRVSSLCQEMEYCRSKPPALPPFTRETGVEKVRLAENAGNSRDPTRVALAYTGDGCPARKPDQRRGASHRKTANYCGPPDRVRPTRLDRTRSMSFRSKWRLARHWNRQTRDGPCPPGRRCCADRS